MQTESTPLLTALERFQLENRSRRYSPTKTDFYQKRLPSFIAWCEERGATRLHDVTPALLRGYLVAAHTVHNGMLHIAGPKPGSKEPLFPTEAMATHAAMSEIDSLIVTPKFCEPPPGAQLEIGVVIERLHSGAWKLGPYDKICFVDCREANRK